MKKNGLLFFMTLMLAVLVAACGTNNASNTSAPESTNGAAPAPAQAEEIVVKHKLGEAKVKKNPEKVVVFDFGSLSTLDKLGVDVLAVPKDSVPSYMPKYKEDKYKNAGGIKEPDFEKISAMAPDLIIISGRQADAYEELNKIAPTIYLDVEYEKYMESFETNAKIIGQIFGKEAEVEKELEQINKDIKALEEKVKAKGKNALIILANEGKVSAYGSGSRFGIIHDVMGFTPVDTNIKASTHGNSVSFEYIVEKDADYLFVVDRGLVAGGKAEQIPAKQVIENDLVKNTKAFKEGNIVYLDPNYWYLSGGGLVSVAEMVKAVDAAVK
ncbi:siderophore ABC transporter substrate-binding protein [Brevibacillus daliensis]|uniref:siderophore ABC transporter substrate-binding protein n=1 Tax=Brevibacillus daliensis TaxID=2892995 RepID=UPI001E4E5CF8|nr:siderophore ABC transporter substrate-binding protein [Brevibacillus daliensis]